MRKIIYSMALLLVMVGCTTKNQQTGEWTYPQAEWNKAKIILMHTPGQSEAYQHRLKAAGVTVEWIELESLIDGYGAAHCMTQVLKRASMFKD